MNAPSSPTPLLPFTFWISPLFYFCLFLCVASLSLFFSFRVSPLAHLLALFPLPLLSTLRYASVSPSFPLFSFLFSRRSLSPLSRALAPCSHCALSLVHCSKAGVSCTAPSGRGATQLSSALPPLSFSTQLALPLLPFHFRALALLFPSPLHSATAVLGHHSISLQYLVANSCIDLLLDASSPACT